MWLVDLKKDARFFKFDFTMQVSLFNPANPPNVQLPYI